MSKKLIAAILAGGILMSSISFTPLLSVAEDNAAEVGKIYVSPNGDDSNSGAKDNPLKTVEAAKAVARIASDGTKDVEVILREG